MSETKEKAKKKTRTTRLIPHYTLEESLRIAHAIQMGNNGKPWKPVFIADYVEIPITSGNFRNLTSSAYRYGLTEGTYNASTISLTSLGQSLTKPTSLEEEITAKQTAVQNIPVYKKIYEHYKDGQLPSKKEKYFLNILESQFKIPSQFVSKCTEQLIANGLFSGILFHSQGAYHVTFEGTSVSSESIEEDTPSSSDDVLTSSEDEAAKIDTTTQQTIPLDTKKHNQIFVVHGRNHKPVEQLKAILEKFKIPYKIAIDEPHMGRPISKKVADLMNECTSAIIIFTADEKYLDANGTEIWRPSDNAVYELGAASILYDKIVILKEDKVTLGSDFSDIGYISFEKDQVEAKAMELIMEFVGSGFVKITPT